MLKNWPLSGLVLRTPLVELRWPSMADLDELASRGAEGVHDPRFMPFFSAWTDGDPQEVAHRVLQRHWAALGAWKLSEWTLYLAVVHEGMVAGSQSIGARNFAQTREVLLTSWLGRGFQGKEIGTHARGAMLHLAFQGLQAEHVLVVVRQENTASLGVCKKFGFVHDGVQVNAVRGERVYSDRYRLSRDVWEGNRLFEVGMSGVTEALPLFGLGSYPGSGPGALVDLSAELLSGVAFVPEPDETA